MSLEEYMQGWGCGAWNGGVGYMAGIANNNDFSRGHAAGRAAYEAAREAEHRRLHACPKCQGSGSDWHEHLKCPACDGTGVTP